MVRTAANPGRTPAAPAASAAASGSVPAASGATDGREPNSAFHSGAQYNGTEDPLLAYCPDGGFTNDDSILAAIDLIENTKTNEYLTNAKMARFTDEGTLKAIHYKRLQVFQLIVNLINGALAIVGPSVVIDKVKENYESMMKGSLTALFILQGGGPSNNATGEPATQKLKRPKIVEVPKFDVNKPGMQTFLNSMALVTKSFKFDSDKDLAQYYLNNLTESSKTLIFSIYIPSE
jgi:hypothetical protein